MCWRSSPNVCLPWWMKEDLCSLCLCQHCTNMLTTHMVPLGLGSGCSELPASSEGPLMATAKQPRWLQGGETTQHWLAPVVRDFGILTSLHWLQFSNNVLWNSPPPPGQPLVLRSLPSSPKTRVGMGGQTSLSYDTVSHSSWGYDENQGLLPRHFCKQVLPSTFLSAHAKRQRGNEILDKVTLLKDPKGWREHGSK